MRTHIQQYADRYLSRTIASSNAIEQYEVTYTHTAVYVSSYCRQIPVEDDRVVKRFTIREQRGHI